MTLALALALVAGSALAWNEWRRRDSSGRIARTALVLVVVASLYRLAEPRAGGSRPSAGPGLPVPLAAPSEVVVGERVVARGIARIAAGDTLRYVLEDATGPRDSALVRHDGAVVELTDRPRAAGAVTYRVRVTSARDGGRVDTLGIAVREARPPAVLVLDGSPSFETAALRRWLGEQSARLLVRTRLSRGRDRVERVNGAEGDPARITPALLDRFDLVVADPGALADLSPAERTALRAAIADDGLGLLLSADLGRALANSEPLLDGFVLEPVMDLDRRMTRVSWTGGRSRGPVPAAPAAIRLRPGLEVVARDELGRPLAAWRALGAGRIGGTVVEAPSRWRLDGEPGSFAAYWSSLLTPLARDTTTAIRVEGPGAPRQDRRTVIRLLTLTEPGPVVVRAPGGGADTVALARDPFDPRLWRGDYWPAATGWHAVGIGERQMPFLVLAAPPDSATGPEARPHSAEQALLFLLLLGGLTWLWAESRRRLAR